MLKKARLSTQAIFFLLFLWLFFETKSRGADELGYPVKVFIDADPLLFIVTSLAARAIDAFPYLTLAVVVMTIFLGRVFCGWICPLGTLHNLVGVFNRRLPRFSRLNWFWIKYALLVFLIVSALFSLNLSGIFDPISLIVRSFSVAVYPALIYAVSPLLKTVDSSGVVFPVADLFFREGFFIGALFLSILALNLVEKRFWCRYLCPLGALLGLFSRYAVLKRTVSEGCNNCGLCEENCPGGTSKAECLVCGDCDDLCPRDAVHFSFGFSRGKVELNLSKRRLTGAVLMGVILPPLLRLSPAGKPSAANEKLIRPPGSVEEGEFLQRCVRCGECMKVCLTNGLQPTFLEAGVTGIWTPVLVPRIGYCEFRCTLCGQVCPTGAIKRLTQAEKKQVKIGIAVIDTARCLPYAYGIPCIVCEEVCPTPKKAIWLTEETIQLRSAKEVTLKRPHVDPFLCVGCGICEAKCPVLSHPAIYVSSIGESRAKAKQFLLGD
ncbi:MAG TPA: 4Fe-4S binding protein [Syntrophales bacterium]|nr:4Fe-4S binding protein [Syntrophales bacterium]HOL59492.1 4Fe-4S binding protein [Syntrophales bacterium]HPO34674.1 4Fe-4S binding protein [Syntrophales bacterium]